MAAVSTEWVDGLVQDRAQESTHLDFKRELPSKKEDGRRELLKDVCALANTEGGRIVYGVDEDDEACASRITPITGEEGDAAQRRLDQAIADGIHPRLVGHSVTFLPVDGGYVLVIDVPPQYGGPFQSSFNNQRRFTYRQGTMNIEMDYNQLRSAFQLRGRALQEATSWRRARLARINDAIRRKRMVDKAWLFIHVIPFSALFDGPLIDLPAVAKANRFLMKPHADFVTFTAEGLLYQNARLGERPTAFIRLLRSGMVEIGWVGKDSAQPGELKIHGVTAAWNIREYTAAAARVLTAAGVTGPAYVALSALGAESHKLEHHEYGTRDQYDTPELWDAEIEPPMLEVSSLQELSTVRDEWARQLADMLFQAFGLERCTYYSEDGTWAPPLY